MDGSGNLIAAEGGHGRPRRGSAGLRAGVRRFSRSLFDVLLGKVATLLLAAGALCLGVATFAVLSDGVPITMRPNATFVMGLSNLVVLLLLCSALAARLTRVWVERRRGSAGARLHVRLVLLFSVVAVTPTILVAVFATVFFNLGIQSWFNDKVRTALQESLEASRGYLEEHRNNIRTDAVLMANDLTRAGQMLSLSTDAFGQILFSQTTLRGLTEAVIFEPETMQVVISAGVLSGFGVDLAHRDAVDAARAGDVPIISGVDDDKVRAVVALNSAPTLMLQIGRPVDQQILNHMTRVERQVAEYKRLDANRPLLQVQFAVIFALVALLVLLAAVLTGLVLATQIARPVGRLIQAAERVRAGDLSVRVPELRSDDEVAGLSRAFNRMTGQLGAQRAELMSAYAQLDERRRFTEGVLSGVSAGVIGLDAAGRIELPNRVASELLGVDLLGALGRPLAEVAPEFAPLLHQASQAPDRPCTTELQFGPGTNPGAGQAGGGQGVQPAGEGMAGSAMNAGAGGAGGSKRRILLVRIAAELNAGRAEGYVVTFDDITELQSAQRKAAWADVARRIAHEIKNPLTPIQLAAERLKRRFTKEITSDPDTFVQCADTIVRQVGDIGRMVDEFSAFARMPQPVIKPEDVGRIAREALVLQRNARPEIQWTTEIPERGPVAPCDRRLLSQALTNLLQNAADAISMRNGAVREGAVRDADAREAGTEGPVGRIHVHVGMTGGTTGPDVSIAVSDDGIGLPDQERERLTEPYVTHKPKGTGLGLAIVKKILEDHGGTVSLDDRPEGQGAVATLHLPARPAEPAEAGRRPAEAAE